MEWLRMVENYGMAEDGRELWNAVRKLCFLYYDFLYVCSILSV